LAQQLIFKGYKRVFVLLGGWKAWSDAGYPIEEKPLMMR
jgi:3-mercaptopyruvate sulfurtransferase SseA